MDMLERHREVKNKPNVYYHNFLNSYHKNNHNEVFIFCEGDVDLSYYGELIDHKYPEKQIVKCIAECKNNIIQIFKRIDWNIYNTKRVLFFVDRDFSYWAGEPQFYASNVYITDGYSFENDAVDEHMFNKCLDDLYGFSNCTIDEKKGMLELYRKKLEEFVQGSYRLMAYAFLHYKTTKLHNASNIKMSKCISFEEENLWKNVIENECSTTFFKKKLDINNNVDLKEIDEIIRRFKEEKKQYSVRGKWSLEFMIMLLEYIMNNAQEFAPSLFDGYNKKPKRIVNLSERGAMSILGPKIIPPKSLVVFLDGNLQ